MKIDRNKLKKSTTEVVRVTSEIYWNIKGVSSIYYSTWDFCKDVFNQICWYYKYLTTLGISFVLFLACRLSGTDWEAAKCNRRILVQRITGHHDCYVMDLWKGKLSAIDI